MWSDSTVAQAGQTSHAATTSGLDVMQPLQVLSLPLLGLGQMI